MTNTTPTPAPISADELAALMALYDKSNLHRKGKWKKRHAGGYGQGAGQFQITEYLIMTADDDVAVCSDCCFPNGEPAEGVADFIAEIHNAAPSLLSELAQLRAENAKLKKELDGLYEDAAGASV